MPTILVCPNQFLNCSTGPARCKCQCSHKVKHPAICCYVTTKTAGVDTRGVQGCGGSRYIKMGKLHTNTSRKMPEIQFLKVT